MSRSDFCNVDRKSDHAIVSRTLIEKARALGVALRQGGTRMTWRVTLFNFLRISALI